MDSHVIFALVIALVAGVMNGSFALATKYIRSWRFETVWLNFGMWAYLIMPWLTLLLFDSSALSVYRLTDASNWFGLIVGGLLFGIGQVCFASALNRIGISLGFVLNIGIGTGLGVLLPLLTLHVGQLFSMAGIVTLLGVFFIFVGLYTSYKAGRLRDHSHVADKQTSGLRGRGGQKYYTVGVLLAVSAGIFSAGQNYTFALTAPMQQIAHSVGVSSFVSSIIVWPPFLTLSFLPYTAYMLFALYKDKAQPLEKNLPRSPLKNVLLTFIMAALMFGSLALYSQASFIIGDLGPVVIWPLFMVMIILTSNFWGWRHKEWKGCDAFTCAKVKLSMAILIIAVLVLAYSATLSHG